MHEGCSLDARAECLQPEQAPQIRRLRRPDTKGNPANVPEHTQDTIRHWPGRGELRWLIRVDSLQRFGHQAVVWSYSGTRASSAASKLAKSSKYFSATTSTANSAAVAR